MKYAIIQLFTVLFFFQFVSIIKINAQTPDKGVLVYRMDLKDEIGPGSWRILKKAIEAAEAAKADYFFIEMNTYGGLLESADSMRTRLLAAKPEVIVYINNNAASAGALISYACDKIYMHPGSSIGAATVVNQNAEALPDKYQSYMRSMMRSTAEATGRDPQIAEAMVDPAVMIPGIIDSGKVLTLTASEALNLKISEGNADDWKDALAKAGVENYSVINFEPTFLDKTIGILVHPALSGILIMIMIGGIYFELQTPGIGFALLAAFIAAVLYFAPLYLEGLAANWEIALFIVGLILLGLEIFVIPGFGIAGVSGIILIVVSLTFSLVANDGFNLPAPKPGDLPGAASLMKPLTIVIFSMLLSGILSFILGRRFMNTGMFKHLVLQDAQTSQSGYVSKEDHLGALVGQEGITETTLRPSGKVRIGENVFQATADTAYIEKGEQVRITRYEGMNLWVKKI